MKIDGLNSLIRLVECLEKEFGEIPNNITVKSEALIKPVFQQVVPDFEKPKDIKITSVTIYGIRIEK